MTKNRISVKVFRFDPAVNEKPYYDIFEVPLADGMSALDVLDFIYHNLDSTIAYYDHAGCTLGICGRCTGRVNGKPGLFCQTPVHDDVTLEPLSSVNVLKDLVCRERKK